MRHPSVGLLLLAVALATVIHAQTGQRAGESAPPTGLLMGVIVDAGDGRPIANAEVTLGGAAPTLRNTRVLADAEGRFVFSDLPKGLYSITAVKPGYAEGAYGRRRPDGQLQMLTLGDAERIPDLKVSMWKFAVVTGRVIDEVGEPVIAIAVRAMQRTVVAGKFKLTPGPTARTDDRGVYRIASLTPGDYAIVVPTTQTSAPDSILDLFRQRFVASPSDSDFLRGVSFSGAELALNMFDRYTPSRDGAVAFLSTGSGSLAGAAPMPQGNSRMFVYSTQYHPAAATPADAATITLGSGDERADVNVQLKLAATSRVSGTVAGPDGPLIAVLSLAPDSDDLSTEVSLETATTVSDAAGRFTFFGVPEGRYRLRALWAHVPAGGGSRGAPPPPLPAGQVPPKAPPLPTLGGFTLWATRTVAVGSDDLNNLSITLSPGHRVSGQAEFIGTAPRPAPEVIRRMTATFDSADGRPLFSTIVGRGQFDETGRLSTYQLPPGRYGVRINNVPPGWDFKSATVNGQDISNVALTLDRDIATVVISFTDRPSSLSGQVLAVSGAPDASATVLVFPADPRGWQDYGGFPRRLRAIRVDRAAQFRTTGLPAGDYLVVALVDELSANWQDPRVLQSLARIATAVSLGDGESRTVALKTSAVAR